MAGKSSPLRAGKEPASYISLLESPTHYLTTSRSFSLGIVCQWQGISPKISRDHQVPSTDRDKSPFLGGQLSVGRIILHHGGFDGVPIGK